MGFTSGRNIDVAFPGLQYGNRQTCGAPKAKKTNSFAMLNAGDTQAAKSDNAGTQQGSDMDVIQAGGQRESKVGARKGILRVSTVHRISSKCRVITQVFHAVVAVPAITIDTAHPGDTDACSQRQVWGCAFDHLPHDLVARNE
jgi:hypothetical protein